MKAVEYVSSIAPAKARVNNFSEKRVKYGDLIEKNTLFVPKFNIRPERDTYDTHDFSKPSDSRVKS